MRFKYPGGIVALVTSIWIIVPFLGIAVAFNLGHFPWYIVAGIVTGLAAIGMWFQVRAAGFVFGCVNILLSVVGLLVLLLDRFSLTLCLRVAVTIYTAYVAFSWTRNSQQVDKDPFQSPEGVGHRTKQIELDEHVAARRPVVAAAKRGMIIGAVIGAVLGAITDLILVAYFLKSPPDTMLFENDSPLLILAIFGIGPVLIGGLACTFGFALGAALRSLFRSGNAAT